MDSNFYKHSKGRVVPVRNRKAVIHIEVEGPIIGSVVEVPASLRETAQQALFLLIIMGAGRPHASAIPAYTSQRQSSPSTQPQGR